MKYIRIGWSPFWHSTINKWIPFFNGMTNQLTSKSCKILVMYYDIFVKE
ncbi:hypothetical protein [Aquimarina sp. I32.4]|nr:hypothetical protein [Aquimarina sp. I32.4]